MLESLRDEGMCFGCGSRNPIGLKLVFEQDGEVTRTTFVGTPEHQGWNGVIHGGLLATLLDETMSQWLWARNIVTMTAEMTTRYRTATPVGVKLTIEARRVAERGRLLQMEAWVKLPDGTVSARATAKFLKVKPEKMPKGALSFEHE
ncbi:MAG TPA: PaaI family thioesterase [Bacillota bacterium]|jgi:acyl-coenzyme A thioesterase PaaI-like protein|nr:PaaI family thioesterase [Peptococcaceae bacterium MAG4]NLW38900.1 PaaI family thioesterase [Peptococcaceae bacterium]HPU35401.1 PaaI family thioesterase [Bacillota bacterium]HPZ43984.1 PaaI family thioesterase [Bacillota bacterium]HQD76465.1 PaaI family thioesterase [Bacillota bacterium]